VRPTPQPELDEGTTAVLAVLRSAVVVTRAGDGSVVRASAAAHAFGLVRDDRVNHEPVRQMLTDVARDGETRDAELELPRGPLGAATIVLQVRAAALGTRHVLLLAEDRTESRRIEAIRRDFVVNVSHELKTPVGALSLLAETVEQAAEDPEAVRRFAGRIQTESVRLSRLVQEIIELSRLQVADPLDQARAVAVDEVVAEAVDRIRTLATAKEIVIEAGGDRSATVWGDHDLLVNAVRNLLDNAVAHSESGTRIAVATTVRRPEGIVEIAVVDQGAGIPPEFLERFFEDFVQLENAGGTGTGLGLPISRRLTHLLGGTLEVESQVGRGSTFRVELPERMPE
jgi:two-component system sensor histidine kinase SenX3